MHVTAGYPTGSAGIADQLPLGHVCPRASSKVSHMAIHTNPGASPQHSMVNGHRIPPGTFIAGRHHGAIGGCILRQPAGSMNIGSHMQAPLPGHRMNAVAKGRSKVIGAWKIPPELKSALLVPAFPLRATLLFLAALAS